MDSICYKEFYSTWLTAQVIIRKGSNLSGHTYNCICPLTFTNVTNNVLYLLEGLQIDGFVIFKINK